MSSGHRGRDQVYAVIRLDPAMGELEHQVTVKEVVWGLELAQAEVARLNQLNGAKGCRYVWQATRLYPPGTAAGHSDGDAAPPAT